MIFIAPGSRGPHGTQFLRTSIAMMPMPRTSMREKMVNAIPSAIRSDCPLRTTTLVLPMTKAALSFSTVARRTRTAPT